MLALIAVIVVFGYFTFQMLATQLYSLLLNQFMLSAAVSQVMALVVVGVVVPVSLAMTFFDLFKPIMSAKNGIEAWLRAHKKNPRIGSCLPYMVSDQCSCPCPL